jgi:type II secretory pathway pseudopilin PulG
VKRKKLGFTTVELLTVLAIIVGLVALLLPAVSVVRNSARETKQRAQLTTIEMGLIAFKNDYGDYPPSSWWDPAAGVSANQDYCGAQKLAEALLGWDLLGFHPQSAWRADGFDGPPPTGTLVYLNTNQNLEQRRGPYLELASAEAFRVGTSAPGMQDGLFDNPAPLARNTYVICDVFGAKKIALTNGTTVKAGTPILYYRANTASKTIMPADSGDLINQIYNFRDNVPLTTLLRSIKSNRDHPLGVPDYGYFYSEYIRDPKVEARAWPYRHDSYLLISAGLDGLYGTSDDVRNFGN